MSSPKKRVTACVKKRVWKSFLWLCSNLHFVSDRERENVDRDINLNNDTVTLNICIYFIIIKLLFSTFNQSVFVA